MATLGLHPILDQKSREICENRCFPVHHPERVWIVKTGSLDLFFQRRNAGGLPGARWHVIRLTAGQAMFGIKIPDSLGVYAVADAHPGTVLSSINIADFRALSIGEGRNVPLTLLRQWIHGLSMATRDAMPPKESQTVSTGVSVYAQDEPVSVAPDEEIVWVTQLRGRSRFRGSEIILPADTFFPLSKAGSAWLQVEDGGVIFGIDFDLISLRDPGWHWLDHFHDVILNFWLQQQERKEQNNRIRISEQGQVDANLIHKALLSLASPWQKAPAEAAVSSSTDPFLAACNAVGKTIGVRFQGAASISGGDYKLKIEAISKASRVRYRRVALRGNWWSRDCGPLLGFLENRPVALLPTHGRFGYRLLDPRNDRFIRVDRLIASQLHPFAFYFYPPFPATKLRGKDLILYGLRASTPELLILVPMGIIGGILNIALPLIMGIIFDTVIPGAERRQLFTLTALLLACSFASVMFTLVRSIAVLRLEARIDATVQPAMWDRLLRLPSSFFRSFSSGDLAVRSMAMSQIREILTNSTLSVILSCIFSTFSFVLLFYYDWMLALVASAMLLICMLILISSGYLLLRYLRDIAPIRGKISSMLLQFVNGISKLRVSGSEGRVFAAWAQAFARQKQIYFKIRRISNQLTIFNAIFPLCALLVIFWCAGGFPGNTSRLHLTTGSFLAFLTAFAQFLATALQLNTAAISVLSIVPLFERAAPILRALPEVDEGKAHPGELKGGLEVNHLNFRYGTETPLILRDISFSVAPGDFIALTGPSGSGKSTLLRLLLGFEQAESGTISYDGQDIAGIDIESVRRQIGVVLQNGRLISGTVFENIVGSLPLSHDQAWEAARLAGLDRDIRSMPMGMHTFVSDGGGGFSGGQRQRLMIARAIVSKPRMFFFDEATSALDNTTQAIVSHSLETLRATRIVIAHRLSTIINADQILVLDKGTIVQRGNYKELVHEPGLFRELVQRQVI